MQCLLGVCKAKRLIPNAPYIHIQFLFLISSLSDQTNLSERGTDRKDEVTLGLVEFGLVACGQGGSVCLGSCDLES